MVYERVSAAIEKSGIKQKVIAERIGVSEQALCSMLAGRRKISADEFFNICLVLNTEPNEMYGFNEKKAV
ncbi:MAG: helix-turn-helix transcriptional regulator [Eubacteriales bacterium]|nr:helix-turn-helix transcriptional regulator [Eubacteriales bacterium]MDD4513766.1 helix-turn-helix transcriptional regulator [Eubacteriales bacterium]